MLLCLMYMPSTCCNFNMVQLQAISQAFTKHELSVLKLETKIVNKCCIFGAL